MAKQSSKFVISALLVATVTLFVWAPANAGTTGVISGYVRDSRTHKPIALATVSYSIGPFIGSGEIISTRTNQDGFYAFVSVAPNTYWELANADVDHVRLSQGPCVPRVTVVADQTTSASFDVFPIPLVITHIFFCQSPPRFKPTWSQLMYLFDQTDHLIL